jgi:hypothetical protein
MRAIVVAALTCAALTTLPLPAAHAEPQTEARCLRPIPSVDYDSERFFLSASIDARGCPAREERRFPITARIVRTDDNGVDEIARTRWCGPFRSGEEGVSYSCGLEVTLAHEAEESAGYLVEVIFPGPDGDETTGMEFGCRTNPEETDCEPAGIGDNQ